jgi:formylglycine-generating enzyme required for sulfatase activity
VILVGVLLLLTAALPVALIASGALQTKSGGDGPEHAGGPPPADADKDKGPPPPVPPDREKEKDKDKAPALPAEKDKDKGAPSPPPARPVLHLKAIARVALETGETQAVTVRVDRDHCPGPVRLEVSGLPDGVRAMPAEIPAGQESAELKLTATAAAALGDGRATLTARADDAQDSGPLDVAVAPGKEYVNSLGMKLVRIPAGKFTMGSPKEEWPRVDNEGPQHTVEITQPFYMGVYPVTQDEYEQVTGKKNPSWFSKDGIGKDEVKDMDTRRFPVEYVAWEEAKAFCEALNQKDTKRSAGWRYELPTEAEWEYACRAGTTTAYSFGDDPKDLKDYAWFNDNCEGRTHEVGTRKANPWGLYDMHGNVMQWCADRYRPYKEESIKDPNREDYNKPQNPEGRVLRGGSFSANPGFCRSAFRVGNSSVRWANYGFRVVLRPAPRTP